MDSNFHSPLCARQLEEMIASIAETKSGILGMIFIALKVFAITALWKIWEAQLVRELIVKKNAADAETLNNSQSAVNIN